MKYKSAVFFGLLIFAYLYVNRPSAQVNDSSTIADSFQDSSIYARQPIIQR